MYARCAVHVAVFSLLLLPACTEPWEGQNPGECTDEADNDGDGLYDCADPDCFASPTSQGDTDTDTDTGDPVVEDCDDGLDNDGDGLTDCEDDDCSDPCTEDCSDEEDNDGDGLVDCEDDDCVDECTEDCSDEEDNDGDGLVDCEDDDCVDECTEDCSDEEDNDRDGFTDCEDDECIGDPACPVEYTVSLTTDLQATLLTSGPWVEYYYGNSTQAWAYGYVEVMGDPADSGAEAFSCFGFFSVDCNYLGGMSYLYGYTAGAGDHVLAFEPSTLDSTLRWYSPDCPVESLPAAQLGFSHQRSNITRSDGEGGWYTQYTTTSGFTYYYLDNDPTFGRAQTYLFYLTQQQTPQWVGSYLLEQDEE